MELLRLLVAIVPIENVLENVLGDETTGITMKSGAIVGSEVDWHEYKVEEKC